MSLNKVHVTFLAEFYSITGKKSVEVQIEEGETVRALLHGLSERFGPDFRKAVFDSSGDTRQNVIIRHNGENIITKKGLETSIRDGDLILIMAAVAGG